MKTTLDLPLFPPLAALDKTAPPSTLSSRAPANFQRKFGKPRDLLCAPPARKPQQAQVAAQPHRKAFAFLLALLLTATALAQQAEQKLIFRCDCQSSLALQMATAVRDEIARSPRYTLVSDIPENQANCFVVDTIAVVDNGWDGSAG
jgi:hypothetical protein